MKKIGIVLIMILLSSKLFAPNDVRSTSKNWKIEYKQIIKEQTNVLLIEIKSIETWHDSLNYKKGNPYKKVNSIGAMGGWQHMPGTLRWLGYRDSTFKRFLNSKELQKKYAIKLLISNLHQLTVRSKKYNLTPIDYIGMRIDTIEVTLSGLLGASWIAGVGGVQRLLARGHNASDGNMTTKDYLYKFRNIMNINPKTKEAYELMHQGILALARAEQQGIRVDVPYVERKMQFLTRRIHRLEADFKDTQFYKDWEKATPPGKLNINSPTQLSNFLYKVKGITPPKFTKSSTDENPKGSSDKETLIQLNIPELNLLIERDKLIRLRDVNLDGYMREQVNGYIHPFFNLHLARTYRSSSSNPNFQNIPIRDEESMQICRGALYPRPGHQLLEIDFGSLEVRVAACYHKDPTMLEYINNPKSDMHTDMAKQIFMLDKLDKSISSHNILRQAAKNGFVFPQFYGDYFKNCAENMAITWGKLPKSRWKPGQGIQIEEGCYLSDHLIAQGIKSFDKFTNHLEDIEHDFWNNRFPVYAQWKEDFYEEYQKQGYVDMFTGFRCSGVMRKNEVINSPIQGAAFHCLLFSFIELDKVQHKQEWDSKLIGQIHDSAMIDCNPSELQHVAKVAKRITCELLPKTWDWIIVPLDIDMAVSSVDKSWAEKEKFKIG
jgi:DNA polymerase I-like protein with 3'-5' exonuclease and polymerase domains